MTYQIETYSVVAIICDYISFLKSGKLKAFVTEHGSITTSKRISDDEANYIIANRELDKENGLFIRNKGYFDNVFCPDCGSKLAFQEGCMKCASHCGYSACA